MKMQEIELYSIDEIKLNPDNPRIIKDESFNKLVKSIQTFPDMLHIRPIVIDTDNMILGGNMRYEACKKIGLKKVPVIKINNLTDEQKKEFIIKDNISNGEWNIDKLINEWNIELLKDWELTDIEKIISNNDIPLNNSNEVNIDNIEDEIILKIKLNESDYYKAVDILRSINDNLGIALMEIINDKS